MNKLFAALIAVIALSFNASALNQYLSVIVTGADHATLRFSSQSNPVNLSNGTEYEVYPGTTVSVTVDTCVLSGGTNAKPRVVLTLHRVGGSGFTAVWSDVKELGSGLGMDCTCHETVTLDKVFLHVVSETPCHPYDPIPPIFQPPFPNPADEDGSGDQYWPPDWVDFSVQGDNENFPGNLVVGTESMFHDYPDNPNVYVHVQMIPYNDNVDFETMMEGGYDVILGADEGPYDTGLANDYQTWVRARFEYCSGEPISGWSVTTVINPLLP